MRQDSKNPDDVVSFKCNICGGNNDVFVRDLNREDPTCSNCHSTVRMRSIVQVLTTELFGKSLRIDEITPPRPDIVGIGMSCWDGYVNRLAHKIAYKNTYYHQEPFLDITNIDPSVERSMDFIVSTDVFEHVAPPVSRAFINARKLLKPGGVFIFTVPYDRPGDSTAECLEWFPNLHEYQIIEQDGKFIMRNVTKDGRHEEFENLCFHGGPGETLEMRRFSEASLIRNLFEAGFNELTFYSKPDWIHGICWKGNYSLPIAARIRNRWPFFKRLSRKSEIRYR